MRRVRWFMVASVLALAGCVGLQDFGKREREQGVLEGGDAGSSMDDASAGDDDSHAPGDDDAPSGANGAAIVEDLLTARNRPGARSTAGLRAWRSGLAVHGERLYWVESGTAPGLYSAPTSCTSNNCVDQLATFTRPSAFTATHAALYTSDTTVIKRLAFTPGAEIEEVAAAPDEVINLASDGESVFWTAGTMRAVWRTPPADTTGAIIHSNGTPVAMGIAGDRLFWAGADISGQLGALQSIGTNGRDAREVSRFSEGFHVMRGNATYLYYAKDNPATILRVTLATGHTEVVATGCLGVNDFAIDDTHVYWVEPGDGPDTKNGQVRRVAHDAKEPELLAVSLPYPVAIAVSGNHVFVATGGTKAKSFGDGRILKLRLGN